jgi:hypothetical protein
MPIKIMPDINKDAPATSNAECFRRSLVKKSTPKANPSAEIIASISPKVTIGVEFVIIAGLIVPVSLIIAMRKPVTATTIPVT